MSAGGGGTHLGPDVRFSCEQCNEACDALHNAALTPPKGELSESSECHEGPYVSSARRRGPQGAAKRGATHAADPKVNLEARERGPRLSPRRQWEGDPVTFDKR